MLKQALPKDSINFTYNNAYICIIELPTLVSLKKNLPTLELGFLLVNVEPNNGDCIA